jgi:hypothetical protein
VADIAALATPDTQDREHAEDFTPFIDGASDLSLGTCPENCPWEEGAKDDPQDVWLLSLEGTWFAARATRYRQGLWLTDLAAPIQGGMSGSPILSAAGEVLALVSTSREENGHLSPDGWHGPGPAVAEALAAWLVRGLSQPKPERRLFEETLDGANYLHSRGPAFLSHLPKEGLLEHARRFETALKRYRALKLTPPDVLTSVADVVRARPGGQRAGRGVIYPTVRQVHRRAPLMRRFETGRPRGSCG